jgi:hypothetical protein
MPNLDEDNYLLSGSLNILNTYRKSLEDAINRCNHDISNHERSIQNLRELNEKYLKALLETDSIIKKM